MIVFVILLLLLLLVGIAMIIYSNSELQKMKVDEKLTDYFNSSYFVFTRKSYNEIITNKGTNGEYKIFSKLRPYEEIGEKFLFNVYLPREDGTTAKIDMLFITTKGIFVIESKNYRGDITGGYDDFWWNQKVGTLNFKFYNPIMQINTQVEVLKKYLPDDLPIYSVVVFSDKCGIYHLPELPRNQFVVNIAHLNILVNEILNNNEDIISYRDVVEIQKALFEYSQAPEYVKAKNIEDNNNMLKLHENERDAEKVPVAYSLKDLLDNGKVLVSE